MALLDTWLDERVIAIYDPVPDHSPLLGPDTPHSANKHALDEALDKLALAVAVLQRAGPYYVRKSEPFWCFAAGSWSRYIYDKMVADARDKLPKRVSVAGDVKYARAVVVEAIARLRRDGDARDARDLSEALEEFMKSNDVA